jgi:hypothetical protein
VVIMTFCVRILGQGCRWGQRVMPNIIRSKFHPWGGNAIPCQIRPHSSSGDQKIRRTVSNTYENIKGSGENIEGSGVQKTRGIGLLFLLGVFLCASLYAGDSSFEEVDKLPVASSSLHGIEWVQFCVKQYPEILWLADENVRKTEEGSATLHGSYSEQLFGKKFIEFDRTIMTLHCLRLIADGGDQAYRQFTKAQAKDVKLSKESFNQLHQQVLLLQRSIPEMTPKEVIQAMEVALVLGDIGKSEKARAIFRPYGAKAPDHDDFHEEVMQILQKRPDLSPTFNSLSPKAKKLLGEAANLAHYGHITHIEGGPSMFSKLKESGQASQVGFFFDFLVHIFDVAGAAGHVDNESSLVYTEPAFKAMQGVFNSCKLLADPSSTEVDAYNANLRIRANWLGLSANDRMGRTLTRVGAMLRLFALEEGAVLRHAFGRLPLDVRTKIIEQLDIGKGEELARTPTYMPALLVNLANNPILGTSKEERTAQAVVLGLPFIARVLEVHKQNIAEGFDSNIPLNFNRAAGVAKVNPFALNEPFIIDAEGDVCVTP